MKECGDNALAVLYSLKDGNVYSDYAMIPFELCAVKVVCGSESKVINGYEELKLVSKKDGEMTEFQIKPYL